MNPLRRKLILSTWRSPKEGNIYGKLTVDAKVALSYLNYRSCITGQKHTITHFVGRAIGEAIKRTPDINGFIRFGRFVPHKDVSLSFLVALEGGKNLGQVKRHERSCSWPSELWSHSTRTAGIFGTEPYIESFESLQWL